MNSTILAKFSGLKARKNIWETLGGFSWLMAERLVYLGTALFVTIPMARLLGPSQFGILSYVLAVASIVASLAALGLQHIVTKELVNSPDQSGKILGTVYGLRALGVALSVAGIALWITLWPPEGEVAELLFLVAAANVLGTLNFLQYWFQAHSLVRVYAMCGIFSSISFGLLRLLFVYYEMGVSEFAYTYAAETAFAGMMMLVMYRSTRNVDQGWQFDLSTARVLFSRSWKLALSGVTAVIYLKIDQVMLADLSSEAELGLYSVAARISEIWYFVPNLLMTAMFPSLLRIKASDPRRFESRLQDILDVFSASATIIAIAITLLSGPLVLFLFGEGFSGSAVILSIHIWSGIFIFMRILLSKWLIIEDLYTFSLVTHGAGALANILLNFLFIPRWGGVGAALATLMSYAVASYFSLLFHSRTRPMFWKMTYALFWPRRLWSLIRRRDSVI